jgi:aminomethyltransferase
MFDVEPIDLDHLPASAHLGPLFERQRALGATFYADYGRLWAASFGTAQDEYRAVRGDVGIWDVSALAKWHVTGPHALAALDRLTTRPTSADDPGQVRYVLLLNREGLLVDEGTRYVLGIDDAWLIGNEDRPHMTEHIVGSVADLEVQVADRTDELAAIAVQGPRSCEVLTPLLDVDLPSLAYYRAIASCSVAGVPAMISRTGFSGELGYELFLFAGEEDAGIVWDRIVDAGATPIGLDAVEILRVEAGLVVADEDYVTGETDPVDVSLERFIELEGTFIGRDAVATRMDRSRRRLLTVVFDDDVDARTEGPLAVSRDGVRVGEVRSIVRSPRFGTIGLAVIDGSLAEVGDRVEIRGSTATVAARPIDGADRARHTVPSATGAWGRPRR